MESTGDFGDRRAPYAPISALERFFEKIRDRAVPDHVDQRFLQRLNVASNNEYSLLSALKFLGIVDDRGRPTTAYRQLQATGGFRETLRHLVNTAYRPVFEEGIERSSLEDLVNYFRVSSSPSQAKNAARFFLAVCRLAGIEREKAVPVAVGPAREYEPEQQDRVDSASSPLTNRNADEALLATKSRLLEKLPAPSVGWTAAEYERVCRLFLDILQNLDATR